MLQGDSAIRSVPVGCDYRVQAGLVGGWQRRLTGCRWIKTRHGLNQILDLRVQQCSAVAGLELLDGVCGAEIPHADVEPVAGSYDADLQVESDFPEPQLVGRHAFVENDLIGGTWNCAHFHDGVGPIASPELVRVVARTAKQVIVAAHAVQTVVAVFSHQKVHR